MRSNRAPAYYFHAHTKNRIHTHILTEKQNTNAIQTGSMKQNQASKTCRKNQEENKRIASMIYNQRVQNTIIFIQKKTIKYNINAHAANILKII